MTEHSPIFEKALEYFKSGRWKESYIRALTKAGKLTPDEYFEITGNVYEEA